MLLYSLDIAQPCMHPVSRRKYVRYRTQLGMRFVLHVTFCPSFDHGKYLLIMGKYLPIMDKYLPIVGKYLPIMGKY